jgi:flagellar export protein FliJ
MTIRLRSLQKITELKNRLTQRANLEYSESLRLLEAEQSRLQELVNEHDQLLAELHEGLNGGSVASHELHNWMQFMISQRQRIEHQHRVIDQKQEDCSVKRVELTDRFQDEQIWLKLRERRLMEHRAHLNKLAQEALDEIAVTGHRRMKG